jgi:hypothetical protein
MDLTRSRFQIGPLCESAKCNTPVVWCYTRNTTALVDAQPSPDGNIQLRDTGMDKPVATALSPAERATKQQGTLHKLHFATCPDAARFRRRR